MNEERNDILGLGHSPDADDPAWKEFRDGLSKRMQNSVLAAGVMQLALHEVCSDKHKKPENVDALRKLIGKDEFWRGQFESQKRAIREIQQAEEVEPAKSLMNVIGEHLVEASFAAISVSLPKAFSVRDEHEFDSFRHLMLRLNEKLRIKEVGHGLHTNGGGTVYWGIVYADGVKPTKEQNLAALSEAGFNQEHNGATIQWD